MKTFLIAIALVTSLSAFAESEIKACGKLVLEKSYDTSLHGNTKVFVVYPSFYRFELSPEDKDAKALRGLLKKATKPGVVAGVCFQGYFAGYFPYSGFSTGGEKISKLKVLKEENLEAFLSYKNLSE